MRAAFFTTLSLTISAALAIAAPPPAGIEARYYCVEDGQCSLGGPADRGQSCSDLNCCSGQKSGAGNGVRGSQPAFLSMWDATVRFEIVLTGMVI